MDVALEQHLQVEIDRELRLVDAAVAMVRRGAARRVTVVNLPLGHEVLDAARARAGLYGLRVQPADDAVSPRTLIVEAPEA